VDEKIVINAPAKLNLFLKVVGKRPDGYHDIETLFEKITLFDKITLKKSKKGIELSCSDANLPTGEENLAYRAAALIKDKTGLSPGVKIEIDKSIPIGAGLGGGSSDAAAVLVGMNRLYGLGLLQAELVGMAGELGADVPFFIYDNSWAVGRERGDKLESIKAPVKIWHVLIASDFSLSAKDAYLWKDKSTEEPGADIGKSLDALKRGDINSLCENLYNDLEGASFEKDGSIKELKDRLVEYGAKGAAVTGSGPVVYGIVETEEEVNRLKVKIEKKRLDTAGRYKIYAVSTLNNN